MILDSLDGYERYVRWWPALGPAFEFLRQRAKPALAEGRYELDGTRMFALVAKYATRDYTSAQPEAHRRYVDVQYLIDGRETSYWTPLGEVAPVTAPYDAERDIVFFGRNERSRLFELAAGHFAIFFPDDAHLPNCHPGPEPARVHKAVVKVELDQAR
jgi:YhcH/YjgK/YiaL family protein